MNEKIIDIIDFRQYLQLCKFTELANLLIAKGIITKQEFDEALEKANQDVMNQQAQKLQHLLKLLTEAKKQPLTEQLTIFRDEICHDVRPIWILKALDQLIENNLTKKP